VGKEERSDIENNREFRINKRNILKALILMNIGLFIAGILSYHFSEYYITIGLSLIIGLTISILGVYFALITKPICVIKEVKTKEEDEELEFQSTMKVE
jgi:uncharacterized membrane protein YfcA